MLSPASLYAPPHLTHAPQPVGWWEYFDAHRDLYMPPQVYSWTCSICASTWVLQATGLHPDAAREAIAGQIGYPNCVNEAVGLADTQCLVSLFEDYGVGAEREWLDWDRAYEIASTTTGCLNSTRWYHFVAIRGVRDGNLWIANSAPGYMGIYDDVTPAQFNAWAGSWQAVWLQR